MYPDTIPHHQTWLIRDTLSNGKKVRIYLECSGNPSGIPVIHLHGGPGDRSTPDLRTLYDPNAYHIILFDQRGCGKSTPRLHTEKNTTQDLLGDIEVIREYVGAEKMVVAGGSWGTSLAMLYAQAYPSRVYALILRGVYDLSDSGLSKYIYPEEEDKLQSIVGKKTGKSYYQRIDTILSKKTKKRRELISLLSNNAPMYVMTNPPKDTYSTNEAVATICNHYELNHYFVPKRELYKKMYKIKHIPTFMVNGRYDIVTPSTIAYTMSKLFTHCELTIVPGGHTYHEPAIIKELVRISDKVKTMIN